jgi:hypothetical protein
VAFNRILIYIALIVGLKVPTAVVMNAVTFWDIPPYSPSHLLHTDFLVGCFSTLKFASETSIYIRVTLAISKKMTTFIRN